ncbi:clathrin assembly family protein, partial [Trifolium medium]|nr:clathrin assembly family protein [Trifolium medium]
MSDRTKSPEKKLDVKVITLKEQESEAGYNEVKALPAPETKNLTPRPQPPPVALEPKEAPRVQQETGELVNLRDDGVSADEQGNKLALA